MSKGVPIKWDICWIDSNFDKYPTLKELNDAYNVSHNTDICYRTFKGVCQRNGYFKSKLTKEQDKFLRETYPKYGVKRTTKLFNEKFKTNKTNLQIRGLACNRHLTINNSDIYKRCRHEKGRWSEGCKYEIGEYTEDWDVQYVKIAKDKFIRASVYNYQKFIGNIPEGHRIIHLDGNIRNDDINNLACISPSWSARLMRNKLYSSEPLVTKGALMVLELEDMIKGERR